MILRPSTQPEHPSLEAEPAIASRFSTGLSIGGSFHGQGAWRRRNRETTTDRTHITTALKHLKQAAYLTDLACESLALANGPAEPWERKPWELTPVPRLAEQSERVRELVFALRAEWHRLEALIESSMPRGPASE